MKMILVSACLIGLNTRYDGKNNFHQVFCDMVKNKIAVPFCPEQAGGLATPRCPSEILGGDGTDVLDENAKVITREGLDVTENFLKGAFETLKLAEIIGAKEAILKSKSPSCGSKCIYDGTFSKKLINGMGVTAAYLYQHNISVIDSDEYLKQRKHS